MSPVKYESPIELIAKHLRQLVLIISVVLATSWCAFAQADFDAYYPFIKFEPRHETPKSTELDDATLEKQGYVVIGTVNVKIPTMECWDGQCENVGSSRANNDPTEALYMAAKAAGADLVQFPRHEEGVDTGWSLRQGNVCLEYDIDEERWPETRHYQVCGKQLNDQYGCETRSETVWKTRTVRTCAKYNQETGKFFSNVSHGVLWRLEPNFEQTLREEKPKYDERVRVQQIEEWLGRVVGHMVDDYNLCSDGRVKSCYKVDKQECWDWGDDAEKVCVARFENEIPHRWDQYNGYDEWYVKLGPCINEYFNERLPTKKSFMCKRALRKEIVNERAMRIIAEVKERVEEEKNLHLPYEMRQARHILILFGDDVGAARTQAEDLLIRIRSGESFAALAAEFSMDSSTASQGGDLGLRPESQLPEALGAVIFAMQKGDLVGPVRSDYGFHIIHLDDIEEVDPPPPD